MPSQHTPRYRHKESSTPLSVDTIGADREGGEYKGKSPRNSRRRQNNIFLYLFHNSYQCRKLIFCIFASGLLISLGLSILMPASFERKQDDIVIQNISSGIEKNKRSIATSIILPQTSSYIFTKPNPQKPPGKDVYRGKLNIKPLPEFESGRIIHDESKEEEGHVYRSRDFENGHDDYRDPYYAFDDDYERNHHCRRTSWHRNYFPNCNVVHETDLRDWKVISHGYYRDVWIPPKRFNEDIVFKTKRIKHKFKYDIYEMTRMDALVMERLASSPRIVDLHAFCAVSIITESLDEDIEYDAVPGSGHLLKHSLNDKYDVDPQNDYTPTEKLEMALQMSEALADLHGFKDGVIVHDDVQLSQFLRNSKTGILKLNDFNRAEVMLWDEDNEEYCRYRNGRVWGNYRSPEEVKDKKLNEKIDVWSLGNNFYALLTGLWIFYGVTDDEVVHGKLTAGGTAYIDPRYRNHSYPESVLVHATEECWKYDPDERVDVFRLVEYLRSAVEKNKQLVKATKKK